MDYAVRNTRVLARRAVSATRRSGAAAPPLVEAVSLLADAVDALVRELGDEPRGDARSRALALRAAQLATAVLADDRGLQTSALVAQVRSTAVDLLRGSGMSEDEAVVALERALGA
jgi:hypothetical protein